MTSGPSLFTKAFGVGCSTYLDSPESVVSSHVVGVTVPAGRRLRD